MKIYFLDLGHLETDMNYAVAGTVRASVDNKAASCVWGRIPIYAVYIDHPKGKILFDTGCRKDAMSGGWSAASVKFCPYLFTPEQTIEHQLKLCGVTPEEIDYLIMSHMHLDHAGNIGLFKNAKVIVQKSEMESALLFTHTVQAIGTYMKDEVDVDANFMLVEGDYTLFEDLRFVSLPGHSEGLMGLRLELKNSGTFLFTSDACYSAGSYGPPAMYPAKIADSKGFVASVEKLRKIANETNATVIFGHDDSQFAGLKKAPSFYD
jgi:glyoxylase-like metal-dependent hydrolase (beta-lactamase superfamily II)